MAVSEVSISNLALQKLGASRITSLSQGTKSANECNACYEHLRDLELRKYKWNFAKTRTTLAPSLVDPDHTYDYAFPLPSDFLRLIPPSVNGLDWSIENHEDQRSILTNDGDTLEIEYIARVEDPTRFDENFVEMLACRMADHMCEALTQSNTKASKALTDYRIAKADAYRANAFEYFSEDPPEDPWLAARR